MRFLTETRRPYLSGGTIWMSRWGLPSMAVSQYLSLMPCLGVLVMCFSLLNTLLRCFVMHWNVFGHVAVKKLQAVTSVCVLLVISAYIAICNAALQSGF